MFRHQNHNENESKLILPNITFAKGTTKIFTFDTEYIHGRKVQAIEIIFNSTIFGSSRKRSSNFGPPNWRGFGVAFAFPGQSVKGFSNMKYTWPIRNQNSPAKYTMEFTITRMEVIAYRNKRTDPCIDNWNTPEFDLRNMVIDAVGCKPPFFKEVKTNFPNCSSQEQLTNIDSTIDSLIAQSKIKTWKYHPCRIIKQFQYTYQDIEEQEEPGIKLKFDFRGTIY